MAAHLCFIMFNLLAGFVGWSLVCDCVVPGHTHLLFAFVCMCRGVEFFTSYVCQRYFSYGVFRIYYCGMFTGLG